MDYYSSHICHSTCQRVSCQIWMSKCILFTGHAGYCTTGSLPAEEDWSDADFEDT